MTTTPWYAEIDEWRSRLDGVTETSTGIRALCPSHPDSTPSLDVDVRGGKVLWTCRAGCAQMDIVRALDAGADREEGPRVTVKATPQLMSRTSRAVVRKDFAMTWWVAHTGVPTDVWEAAGVESDGDAVVFKFPGIDAEKRRYRPTDEKPKGVEWRGRLRPILWPAPPAAVGPEVHVAVGESDCGALLASGFEAYALTKGDAGIGELFRALRVLRDRGAERVVVWTDADSSGRKARSSIVDAVQAVGLPAIYPDMDAITDPLTGEKDVCDVYRRLGADALVEAASAALVDVPEPPRTMTHDEMLDSADEAVEYDIEGLVSPGEKVILGGPPKSRKTWLAVHLVSCLVLGKPFMGSDAWAVTTPRKVMYVGEEGVKQKFARRIRRTGIPRGSEMVAWKHRTQFSLASEARVGALIDELRDGAYEVLILDPFQRMAGGLEENSATEMAVVWDAVAKIQGALPRVTVWIVFHTRKDASMSLDDIRGSGRHAGELDVALLVRKEDEDHSLVVIEGRDLPPVQGAGDALLVRFDITDTSLDVTIEGNVGLKVTVLTADDRKEQILAALIDAGAAGATVDDVMAATSLADKSVRNYLGDLVSDGSAVILTAGKRGSPATYAVASLAP